MKRTIAFLLTLSFCSVLLLGCGISDEDEDRGKAPKIEYVKFYKDASTTSSVSIFYVGDTLFFRVDFEDPDLDVATLHVIIYDLGNPDAIYDGPTVYELSAEQQSENSISEILDAAFTAGEYRVDFQAVDEKSNISLMARRKIIFLPL